MRRFRSRLFCAIWLCLAHASLLFAQTGEAPTITFGAFVDTYYAFDFGRPTTRDRAYTTQPARHNEFNINLAFVEAKLSGEHVRGRFALQTGTSVNLNYAAETNNRELSQLLQEAVAGFRLADNIWIDAGIYLSHIGLEAWISRDNWTYTRSLCSDFSPYYQTGVKATLQASPKFALQLHVLNGWQNIAETNNNKALGLQAALTLSERVSLTYNNFLGNEQSDSLVARLRFFNDVVLISNRTIFSIACKTVSRTIRCIKRIISNRSARVIWLSLTCGIKSLLCQRTTRTGRAQSKSPESVCKELYIVLAAAPQCQRHAPSGRSSRTNCRDDDTLDFTTRAMQVAATKNPAL